MARSDLEVLQDYVSYMSGYLLSCEDLYFEGLESFLERRDLEAGQRDVLNGVLNTLGPKKWRAVMKTKRCSKCKEYKSLDMFNKNSAAPDGKSYMCKPCYKAYREDPARKPVYKKRIPTKKVKRVPFLSKTEIPCMVPGCKNTVTVTYETAVGLPKGLHKRCSAHNNSIRGLADDDYSISGAY